MDLVEVPTHSDFLHAAIFLEDRKLFLDFHQPYYLRRCRHRLQKSQFKQQTERMYLLNGRVQNEGRILIRFDSEIHGIWGAPLRLPFNSLNSSLLWISAGPRVVRPIGGQNGHCCSRLCIYNTTAQPRTKGAPGPAFHGQGLRSRKQPCTCDCGQVNRMRLSAALGTAVPALTFTSPEPQLSSNGRWGRLQRGRGGRGGGGHKNEERSPKR